MVWYNMYNYWWAQAAGGKLANELWVKEQMDKIHTAEEDDMYGTSVPSIASEKGYNSQFDMPYCFSIRQGGMTK